MNYRKIVDFKIIDAHNNNCKTLQEFEKCIMDFINNGYVPIGGISFQMCENYSNIYQSMIKYEEQK